MVDDGRIVTFSAPKERTLLASLAAEAGRTVAVDRLIDILWGDEPPRTARKTLQTYVMHLRQSLGALGDRLRHEPPGYVLDLGVDALDSKVFERLVAEGRLAILRNAHTDAVELLGAALALHRGPPYSGVDPVDSVQLEAIRLGELRLSVTEDWLDARLAGGDRHLVAELETLVLQHPLRERMWALLMRALDRAGRRADALRVYQRARAVLAEEVGLEPGPQLRATEAEILADADHQLAPAPQPTYATTADGLRIAYWTWGEGAVDVVFCAEWTLNVELLWEIEELRPVVEGLSTGTRLVVIQRRGAGVSDRDPRGFVAPEGCLADVDAVLDAVGVRSAAFVGWGHGGQIALAYAATRGHRVDSVAVVNSYARLTRSPTNPGGADRQSLESFLGLMATTWGQPVPKHGIVPPERATDPTVIARFARYERLTASPGEAVETQRIAADFDISHLLQAVGCPVLVVHLSDSVTGADNARHLAGSLPDASYVELPGHFVPTAEQAHAVAEALRDFHRSPRPPGGSTTARPARRMVEG